MDVPDSTSMGATTTETPDRAGNEETNDVTTAGVEVDVSSCKTIDDDDDDDDDDDEIASVPSALFWCMVVGVDSVVSVVEAGCVGLGLTSFDKS